MFFDDDTHEMSEILSAITPTRESARMVAAALKGDGAKYEETFYTWAKAFGRYRAKTVWRSVVPDPDALEAVIDEQYTAQARKGRFLLHSASGLPAYDSQYRIKGVFPAHGVVVLYGASGSGKSFIALAMAAAIAAGAPFFGKPTARSLVLYVVLEGEAGFVNRVRALETRSGAMLSDDIGILLQQFTLTDANDVEDLAAVCPRGCVIIIDTLNRSAPGIDENSSKDMGAVIGAAKRLQELTGGLIVLVSHSGKDAAKGLRGHSSLYAAVDAVVLVSRDGDRRRWRVEKSKDGQDGEEFSFRLSVVELGLDADGDPITSCIVEQDSEPPRSKGARPMSQSHRTAVAAFKNAAVASGNIAADGRSIGVDLEAYRREFYRICPADNDEAKRKAFQRARNDLIERGELAVVDNVYRLVGADADTFSKFAAAKLKARDTGTGQRHLLDMSHVEPPP